jgi:AraC-like DNA-binding protein
MMPFDGTSLHYIDGKKYSTQKHKLMIVNSLALHRIIPFSPNDNKKQLLATVLLISHDYLLELIPDFDSYYFQLPNSRDFPEIFEVMKKISDYAASNGDKEEADLYIKGLVDILLYYILENAKIKKDIYSPIKNKNNIERLKGTLAYIQKNYRKQITQYEIANEFGFSKDYFSRFFHKTTGITFFEYLNEYRVSQAHIELIETDKKIIDIALNNGFTDSRRFIIGFKKVYKMTPLQYRKKYKK